MENIKREAISNVCYSEIINSELIDLIVKEINEINPELFLVGSTGDNDVDSPTLKDVRDSKVYWLEDSHWICSIFRHYFEKANRECWEYDLENIESVQVSKYDKDGHYTWHGDYGIDDLENTRKLSASMFITNEDEYEGGELQLIDYHANVVTIPKKKGTIVIFDSRVPHRVSKVERGTRISLVSWMRGPKLR
jgi:Rps23 Pro-64 3,4-dihydroxylase Tpa1-like proline 4-hydroxylase